VTSNYRSSEHEDQHRRFVLSPVPLLFIVYTSDRGVPHFNALDGRDVGRAGKQRRRRGSGGRKSLSGVQGRSPGRRFGGLAGRIFYSASALLAVQTAVIARAVCLSVRPSVQTNEDTIMQSSAFGRTIILVFGEVKFIRIFAGDHP